MGRLLDGTWTQEGYGTEDNDGHFRREDSHFRHWITADGRPGPSGDGGFPAESGRYHLYVSYACPWAHRTLIFRALKGLQSMIPVHVVHPLMLERGWTFETDLPGTTGDPNYGLETLWQLYVRSQPDATGRVTVPVLWDTRTEQIVSNESAEILRMFNSAFDGLGAAPGDYYPAALRDTIDALNDWIYDKINNGVYKAGFASTQEAYDEAVTELFAALDTLEQRLSRQAWLVGATQTEADWRLFTTLIRFDAVYATHFKCDRRRIEDYPNLSQYLRALYQHPGIAETVRLDHIRPHYFRSHRFINPTGIVSIGPEPDFDRPHDRGRFTQEDH